jgi:DnaJ-related protein SCJ1
MKTYFSRLFLLSIFLLKIICEKDLYKTFELERNASQNDIKKKYRELTKKYHPDKNQGSPEASSKFAEVAEAYEILSDPKKRRQYDRGGMNAVKNSNEGEGFDPFNIFDMFGGGGRKGENRDADTRIKIRVSLKDLYLGKEYEVEYYIIHNNSLLIPETQCALIAEETEQIPTTIYTNAIDAKDKE